MYRRSNVANSAVKNLRERERVQRSGGRDERGSVDRYRRQGFDVSHECEEEWVLLPCTPRDFSRNTDRVDLCLEEVERARIGVRLRLSMISASPSSEKVSQGGRLRLEHGRAM